MPYRHKAGVCDKCGRGFRRTSLEQTGHIQCPKGAAASAALNPFDTFEPMAAPPEVIPMEGRRVCRVCLGWTENENGRHKKCARRPDWEPPSEEADRSAGSMAVPAPPPFKQAVFDIETWGLDRSWGVMLMATVLVHGQGKPTLHTYSLRDSDSYKNGKRGDDSEIFLKLYYTLEPCAILYGHNARWFDMRWVNALCLAYGVAPLKRKLVDPCQVSKNNFAIANNSLASLQDFTNAQYPKMPLGERVWRNAILNDDDDAWAQLRERNVSDVLALNELATKVAPFVGLVDFAGSAWR